MLLEESKVDLELVCNVVVDMLSGSYSEEHWYGFLQGMSLADEKQETMWYLDCAYSKLLGNKVTTSVIAGTPTDVLDENFRTIVSYGSDNGYFDIDTILDYL